MQDKKSINLTYYIGAGASANAIPIVGEFNFYLDLFYKDLRSIFKDDKATNRERNLFYQYQEIVSHISEHQTPDTYFRKLYIKKDFNRYELGKRLLSAFFIYQQLPKQKSRINSLLTDTFISHSDEYRSDLLNKINAVLDKRYDPFFATLLNSSSILPENINVISWNYDEQFEMSYLDFTTNVSLKDISSAQKKLNIFSGFSKSSNSDKSQIIKINGTANFIDTNGRFLSDVFNHKKQYESTIDSILSYLFDTSNFQTTLKFSWEEGEMTNKAINRANKIIQETDVLVIIGYTFPNFNSEIDQRIFSGENTIKKIYYQIPVGDAPLLERLNQFDLRPINGISHYMDVKQFLIPMEYFRPQMIKKDPAHHG